MNSPTAALVASLDLAAKEALPRAVVRTAGDTIFNVAGIAIGATRYPGVESILRTASEIGGEARALVPGRIERTDSHYAALATGFAAHVDDYDDTHLATAIHPGATCFATLVGIAPYTNASGADFLRAFALGCEVQLRFGFALNPAHYDAGWHITGTAGVLGAATTAGLLLGLRAERLRNALVITASTLLGHRVGFGTMIKPYHPGKAAANGILGALLAAEGFEGAPGAIEATHGFADVLSSRYDLSRIGDPFGERWELLDNTFKPYPCGLVAHPAIDAAIELGGQIPDPATIESIRVECQPIVLELMGKPPPKDSLEARFSARYAVAVGLADRKAGIPQFSDERLGEPDVARLARLVELVPDERIARDEARVTVTLRDGRSLSNHVVHARGSKDRPLSTQELFDKIDELVEPVMPGAARPLRAAVDGLEDAAGASGLLSALVPRDGA